MRSTRWIMLAATALVLGAPAAASAMPIGAGKAAKGKPAKGKPATVRSIGDIPRSVEAGDDFRLSVTVRNTANRAVRPRVEVRLRKLRYAKGGRVVAAERLSRLKGDRQKRVRLTVEIPSGLAAGSYYLDVCVRAAGRSAQCKTASRKLTVTRPPSGPQPGPGPDPDKRYSVLILTESRSTADAAATAAGVKAIEEVGRGDYKVTVASDSRGHFTEANLKEFRTVVFLNTVGDVLSDNEQSAFEDYFRQGGGFLGLGSAIDAEPSWAYHDQPARDPRGGTEPALGA